MRQITHALLTRPPLSRPSVRKLPGASLDLHVLGTPPAFILSQDQTLRLKRAASLPHPFDLGFRRLPRPFGGLGSPGGHLSIRFISQYPVFKVLASPSGGPRRLPSGRAAQGGTIPSRCHPVKNFFSKTFEDFRDAVETDSRSSCS